MPIRVLHLLPDLTYSAASTQVATLAGQLPTSEFEQRVAALRSSGGSRKRLAAAGPAIEPLNCRFAYDPFALLSLRRAIHRFKPDVVHAWGPAATSYAAASRTKTRLIATALGEPVPGFVQRRIQTTLDPTLGVPAPPETCPSREQLGLPGEGRLVAVVGRLEPDKRLKDLIWAIDVVRVLRDDVWLVVIGEGPQRGSLEEFSRLACEENRTLWLGGRDDVSDLLPHCDMFWHAERSTKTPLAVIEAMAARLPVVADRAPGIERAMEHERTGLLVPPGDRAARGKACMKLLEDNQLRESLGHAAREHVQQAYALAPWIEAHRQAYRSA